MGSAIRFQSVSIAFSDWWCARSQSRERLLVETRVLGIEPLDLRRGECGSEALADRQRRVEQQRLRQMERGGEAGARDQRRALALAEDGDVEAALQRQQVLDAEPAQEAEVGGAAAQSDVLAVVELEAVALEGEGRAAEPRAATRTA